MNQLRHFIKDTTSKNDTNPAVKDPYWKEIFEYECVDCNNKFRAHYKKNSCPKCGSNFTNARIEKGVHA